MEFKKRRLSELEKENDRYSSGFEKVSKLGDLVDEMKLALETNGPILSAMKMETQELVEKLDAQSKVGLI